MKLIALLALISTGCASPRDQSRSFFDELHLGYEYGVLDAKTSSSFSTWNPWKKKDISSGNGGIDGNIHMFKIGVTKYLNENPNTKLLRLYLQRLEAQNKLETPTHPPKPSHNEWGHPQ